jgi:hypothetical protein
MGIDLPYVVAVIIPSEECSEIYFDENEEEELDGVVTSGISSAEATTSNSTKLIVNQTCSLPVEIMTEQNSSEADNQLVIKTYNEHDPLATIVGSSINKSPSVARRLPIILAKSQKLHENECEFCHKVFTLRCNLLSHRRQHLGDTNCPYCEKILSTKGNLKKHMETVHGDLPVS